MSLNDEIAALEKQVQEKRMRERIAALKAELAAEPAAAPVSSKKPRAKKTDGPKVKKAPTNTGSVAFASWNERVKETWIELAAAGGVAYEEHVSLEGVDPEDKDALYKAEAAWRKACKSIGVTRITAMKEAGNRQRAERGEAPLGTAQEAVEELEAEAPVAKAPAAKAKAPAPAAPAAKALDQVKAEFMAEFEVIKSSGVSYFMNKSTCEVISIVGEPEDCELGEHVGEWDADLEEIDYSA
jgi:hypothetical protein